MFWPIVRFEIGYHQNAVGRAREAHMGIDMVRRQFCFYEVGIR